MFLRRIFGETSEGGPGAGAYFLMQDRIDYKGKLVCDVTVAPPHVTVAGLRKDWGLQPGRVAWKMCHIT